MRRRPTGLSLPEIMISLFLFSLVTAMILSVMEVQRTQAHSSESRMSARKSVQLLFHNLHTSLEETSAAGIEVAADNRAFSIQTINGVASNGTRSWSPFLTVYRYDPGNKVLQEGRIDVTTIGLTHQATLPAPVTQDKLQEAIAVLENNADFKVVANGVESFEVSTPGAQTVEVKLETVVKSGRYKDERIKGERIFFFASSADI